jgi:RNA polymerase-binding transcription factor DksA
MNLRRKTPNDSLYLLLDTLCNTFGGIILLAVLVVILTNREKLQSAGVSDSPEMLQRRLALALTNLQQSLQLVNSLQARAGDVRWKEQVALLEQRKDLQDAIQQSRDTMAQNSKDLDAANAADPADRLKRLNAELAAAQARLAERSNSLAAVNENIKRLNQRRAAMEPQVAARLKDLQRPLRLPKEHETAAKRVVYVILRFGRAYPCRNADFGRNETDITWTTFFQWAVATPIKDKGMDPARDAAALNGYFKSLSDESVYVVFCAYDDSFPAFLRVRELAVANGLTYGWDPFLSSDGSVKFVAGGYVPKPQ